MIRLPERKEKILSAIIESYLKTAQPVSSQMLANRRGFSFSSATIRNEMAELEEDGYIIQPHTSAGRLPSDKGYRYYVDNLMKPGQLTPREENFLKQKLKEAGEDIEDIIRQTLKVASMLSHYASVILSPISYKKNKLEFKERVYADGISNILKCPEFSDISHARPIFEIFEEEETLAKVIKEEIEPNKITIKIGRENKYKSLKETSILLTTYNCFEASFGIIGILGPKRMRYEHCTAILSNTASNLSSIFSSEEV